MNDYKKKKQQGLQEVMSPYAQIQPQAPEVEKAVLGALMIDKDAYVVVCEILKPKSFYEPRHQKIYEAIEHLSINEKPIDVLTVTEQLAKDGTLEEVGGAAYIAELSSKVATSANIVYHANIIAEKYLSRQMINYANTIGTKAYDDTNDVKDVIMEAERILFEIAQTNMKKDYTDIKTLVGMSTKTMMKNSENKGDVSGISTGYYSLDHLTSGWQNSDLVIIAGRPAMGKTAFALSMAKNIAADQNIPMAFFSLEMSGEQLSNRLISNVCEIEGRKILSGQLDRTEWERFDKRINNLIDAPLYIDDTPGLSIFELKTKAHRMVRERGVRLIMIDYLQLMNANGMRFNSRQEEVAKISQSLKELAKDLNIPILALSQLNRGVEGRDGAEGKRPLLSDLRESGAIEQDADMVIFVHRPEYYKIFEDNNGNSLRGMAYICIAKHRKGAVDDVLLSFKGEFTRFANREDNDPYSSNNDGGTYRSSGLNTDSQADDNPYIGGPISNDDPPF